MRDKKFLIKYRYANTSSESVSLPENDENLDNQEKELIERQQQYAIDVSSEINQRQLQTLSYEYIIKLLKDDFAIFNESNVKFRQGLYWMQLDDQFEIDFTLIDDEDWEYDEISLLLQRKPSEQIKLKDQTNDTIEKLAKDYERFQVQLDDVDTQLNEIAHYIANEFDQRMSQTIEEVIENLLLDKLKQQLNDDWNQKFYEFQRDIQQEIINGIYKAVKQNKAGDQQNLFGSENKNENEKNQNINFALTFENQSFQNIKLHSSQMKSQHIEEQNSYEGKERDVFLQQLPKQESILGESYSAVFAQPQEGLENVEGEKKDNNLNTSKTLILSGQVDKMLQDSSPVESRSQDIEQKNNENMNLAVDADDEMQYTKSSEQIAASNDNGRNYKNDSFSNSNIQSQQEQQSQQQSPSLGQNDFSLENNTSQPIFKFNIDIDAPKEEGQQRGDKQMSFKPIVFELPSGESDSQNIDFFKNIKHPKKDRKVHLPAVQQQGDPLSDTENKSSCITKKNEINSPIKDQSKELKFIPSNSTPMQSSITIKGIGNEINNSILLLNPSTNPPISNIQKSSRGFEIGNNQNQLKKIEGNDITNHNNNNNNNNSDPPPSARSLMIDSQSQRKIQLFNSVHTSNSNVRSSPRGTTRGENIPKILMSSKMSLQESISQIRGLSSHESVISAVGTSNRSRLMKPLDTSSITNIINGNSLKINNVTDMTIMYSEPLVKMGGQNMYVPAGDPVDFELEIQKLNEFLNETNKQIKLDVVVASLDNLEKSITRNTQILHIMCHGDYSEKDQNYYLAFEDEESKLDPVTSKRFQEFFKNKNSNVKLVFFNACHSEEVGKIFQEAGVPFVIAVQSDLKIEDKAALTFSSSFYMNVFSGHSVEESFESAKSSLQAKQHDSCFTCCCAHSHDDNCSWFIEAMNGFDSAHLQHKPDVRCKCPNSKKLFHEYTCEWVHEFLNKYRDDYEDYVESLSGSELFACCCHTPETPHDESLKFRLIKNKSQDDCKLMMNLPEGSIIQKSNLDFNHPIFQDQQKIFGRNLDIFKMYRWLMVNQKLKTKFIAINGELGAGKTAVAKKVARHLRERGQVTDIILEDFEKMKTKITKFEQKMRLNQHTKELAYNILKSNKTLFILDNCDDLIKNNKSKFESILNDLSLNTPAKFIILSHEKHDLKLGQGPMLQITLGDLNELCVKQLIEFYAGESIKENFNNPQFILQLQELIRIMPKSPKTIMETVQNITEGMDIIQILNSFKDCKVSEKSKDFAAFNLLIKELKVSNQSAYEMLLLVSLFPHGVTVEDLKFLEKHKKIPHDWMKIMLSLTEFKNESQSGTSSINNLKQNLEQNTHNDTQDNETIGSLQRIPSKRLKCNEDEDLEEDDFDNDAQQEESYRFKKFKNGQYFWMSVTRKCDIVVFKIKKFVVQQLKQLDYRDDLFPKEMLILEYLSTFAKRLLRHLKDKSHHEERIIEYCSLSLSGIFGLHFSQKHQHESNSNLITKTEQISGTHASHSIPTRSTSKHPTVESSNLSPPKATLPDGTLHPCSAAMHTQILKHGNFLDSQPNDIDSSNSENNKNEDDDDENNENDQPTHLKGTQLSSNLNLKHKDSTHPDSKESIDNIDINILNSLPVSEIFKIHEGNFYSYLNVDDHRPLISYVNSKACNEKKKQKIKRNIQDLCVNIPSIHKLLDEVSTSEEQCQQAEQVLDELLKNTQNSQFLLAKAKLLFIKISLYVDRYVSDRSGTIEDVIHFDEIEGMQDEIDKKFADFDKNEVFTELIDIEKQFIVFYLLYQSYRSNKECEQSHVYEVVLKLSKESSRLCGVKQRITQLLENLIPELLSRVQALRLKDKSLDDQTKDIKFNVNSLDILESKIHLLNGQIELEFNRISKTNLEQLEQAIQIFQKCSLHSLMILTTMVYCKKRLFALKNSRDTQPLIKLKKELIDPAIVASKQWKLTSLEADCKKILGEINDQLHTISSNVFQFMKACPLMMDKNNQYGHIIRLNQSFKRRVTDVLSQQGKELNVKFEIQTVKHFRECLQRGSKFMCIQCDEYEEDGLVVEDDQLPLLRKYKEQEMEEYYKQHYEELGQIEILMLCSPNGMKLKEMFSRIVEKVNSTIKKVQDNPDLLHKLSEVGDKENAVAGDSEMRRNPTIIAFQFKPTGQKQFQSLNVRTEKRRQTILQQKQIQQAIEELKDQGCSSSKLDHQGQQQMNKQRKGKKGDENNQGMNQNNKSSNLDGSDSNVMHDFDDFYLFYLKEFATQQFQFEFVTQLLKDKPDPNPQVHIKKAFNLAQQKMVTETIRICGEDIKDEQSFEQILGKGPELFLSDSWKDAKFEFKKGQLIDITSERPPQNLNRNFLRISGRKQDIFILLQKIQENSVNIFGTVGIGKTIVAQQIAYLTFSRNTFSDGVYYFSMKELVNFNYDLKQYMESLLGLQFGQDISGYFQSQKNMLLLFDDFDIVVSSQLQQQPQQLDQPKIQYFEYIFSFINKYDIHYILITHKSLRHILNQNSNPKTSSNYSALSINPSTHIKSNMYYHEIKPFSRKEALNFLDSLLDLEQINIRNILENRKKFLKIYQKAQGHPKRLIQEYCLQFGNPKIPQQFKSVKNQHCEAERLPVVPSVSPSPFSGNQHNNKNNSSNRDLSIVSSYSGGLPSLSAISSTSNTFVQKGAIRGAGRNNNSMYNGKASGYHYQMYQSSEDNRNIDNQFSMDSNLPNSQVFNSNYNNSINNSSNSFNSFQNNHLLINKYSQQQMTEFGYQNTQGFVNHPQIRQKNQNNRIRAVRNFSSHSNRNQPQYDLHDMSRDCFQSNDEDNSYNSRNISQMQQNKDHNNSMLHHQSIYSKQKQQTTQEDDDSEQDQQQQQQQHLNHHKESCQIDMNLQTSNILQYPFGSQQQFNQQKDNRRQNSPIKKRGKHIQLQVEDLENNQLSQSQNLDLLAGSPPDSPGPPPASPSIAGAVDPSEDNNYFHKTHSSSLIHQLQLSPLNLNASVQSSGPNYQSYSSHKPQKNNKNSGFKSNQNDKCNQSCLSEQQQLRHSFSMCEEDFQDEFIWELPQTQNNWDYLDTQLDSEKFIEELFGLSELGVHNEMDDSSVKKGNDCSCNGDGCQSCEQLSGKINEQVLELSKKEPVLLRDEEEKRQQYDGGLKKEIVQQKQEKFIGITMKKGEQQQLKYGDDQDESDESFSLRKQISEGDGSDDLSKRRSRTKRRLIRQSIIQEYADEDMDMQESMGKKGSISGKVSKKTSFVMQSKKSMEFQESNEEDLDEGRNEGVDLINNQHSDDETGSLEEDDNSEGEDDNKNRFEEKSKKKKNRDDLNVVPHNHRQSHDHKNKDNHMNNLQEGVASHSTSLPQRNIEETNHSLELGLSPNVLACQEQKIEKTTISCEKHQLTNQNQDILHALELSKVDSTSSQTHSISRQGKHQSQSSKHKSKNRSNSPGKQVKNLNKKSKDKKQHNSKENNEVNNQQQKQQEELSHKEQEVNEERKSYYQEQDGLSNDEEDEDDDNY